MHELILLAAVNKMWHAVPLIVVISLVYSATRHENPEPILRNALRLGVMITIFMGAIFVLLMLMSWML